MGGDGFRLYGTADPENNQTPPAGGMRGEGNAIPEGSDESLTHEMTSSDGRVLTLDEQSGVSFVEASGRAGERASAAEPVRSAGPGWGTLLLAGTLGFLLGRRATRPRGVASPTRLAPPPVRDAGPGSMADAGPPGWDRVDEGSDESFPASDPPSYATPGR
ncbi:hypothetical protein [Sphingomonas sp. BK069]|uniref:hypothetical protein n=1 Tax=Sphingomonas sp. BK069 TaxID=2586979 RepID=UPI0017EF724B|nr:hypothetical protein [Sphingomonas sp. BK069]MBB3345740.1 hypothetical protein [Sphingomonas sp. BK069]